MSKSISIILLVILFLGVLQTKIVEKNIIVNQFLEKIEDRAEHDQIRFSELAKRRAKTPSLVYLSSSLSDMLEDPYEISTYNELQQIADSNDVFLPPFLPNIVYAKKIIKYLHSIPLPSQTQSTLLVENLENLDKNNVRLNISLFNQFQKANIKYSLNDVHLDESRLNDISNLNSLKVSITNSITGEKYIVNPEN